MARLEMARAIFASGGYQSKGTNAGRNVHQTLAFVCCELPSMEVQARTAAEHLCMQRPQ